MPERNFEARLEILRSKVAPLARVVHALAGSLPAAIRYHSGQEHHGYRYVKAGIVHFCLLKAVRAMSALNAALALARSGYTQEIGLLIRALVECTMLIEFVLSGRDQGGNLEPEAEKLVRDYFADFARTAPPISGERRSGKGL
jgi:hypothetical protein